MCSKETVAVARRKKSKSGTTQGSTAGSRLELIRKRHHELILQTRELIAADLDDEFEDGFSEAEEVEELEFAEASNADSL